MAHQSNNGHDPLAVTPSLQPVDRVTQPGDEGRGDASPTGSLPTISPDPRPERLVIWGVPDQGYTQAEAMLNIRQLAAHLGILQEQCAHDQTRPRWVFGFHSIGRILTPVAREHLCKIAMAQKAEFILMTDNDGIFPPDLFERLVAHDVEVVAPLAFTRNPPHLPVLYRVNQGFDVMSRKPWFLCEYVPKYPRRTLVQVDATGFHAVLIKTAVLQRMTPPYFFSTTGTGEDIFFCIQAARQAKAKIFVDTAINTGHLSDPTVIDEGYAQAQWKMKFGIELGTETVQSVPPAPDPLPVMVLGV